MFIQFHFSGSESKKEAIPQAEQSGTELRENIYLRTHATIYTHTYFYIFTDLCLNIHAPLFQWCITTRTSKRRMWKGSRIISHWSGTNPGLSALSSQTGSNCVHTTRKTSCFPQACDHFSRTQEDHDLDGYHSSVQQVALQPKAIYVECSRSSPSAI